MKKLLLILAVAGFAVACNNASEEKKAESADTTVSTMEPAPATMDTAASTMTDTTKMMSADTTKK
jgi:hypothetical protein